MDGDHTMAKHPVRRWAAVTLALAVAAGILVWWANTHDTPDGVDLGDVIAGSPVWAADGDVYYVAWPAPVASDSDVYPGSLWRTRPGGHPEPVAVTAPDCAEPDIVDAFAMAGDVGIWADCSGLYGPGQETQLFRYHVAQQTVQLVETIPDGLRNPTWRVDGAYGYAASGSSYQIVDEYCFGGLVRLPATDMALLLAVAQRTCVWEGPTSAAQLTLGDTHLVFMTTTGCPEVVPVKSSTVDKAADWSLCVLDLTTHAARTVESGFSQYPYVQVDPNLRHALVTGGREGKQGIWLLDLQTSKTTLLTTDYRASAAFSPDGLSLVIIYDAHTLTTHPLP